MTRLTVSVSAPIWPSPLRNKLDRDDAAKRADDRPGPAGQLGAAQHHGGDRPEFEQLAVIGVHRAAFGIEHHRRERRQKADHHEVDHHVRSDANAGIDRRLAVVADGIGVAAMNGAVHQEPEPPTHGKKEPGCRVQAQKLRLGEIDQRPVEVGGRLSPLYMKTRPR
jgi:hypothetical protein